MILRLRMCGWRWRAIAEHLTEKKKRPSVLVGYDTRVFISEEFFGAGGEDFAGVWDSYAAMRDVYPPTPAIAYEIQRRKIEWGRSISRQATTRHSIHGLEIF